jgi:mannosyl-oligosaccharide alpha-1,2-mannosidase
VTRDPKWRERAWQIFEAIERHARLEVGYATVRDVTIPRTTRLAREKYYQNEMASWFFAETCVCVVFQGRGG